MPGLSSALVGTQGIWHVTPGDIADAGMFCNYRHHSWYLTRSPLRPHLALHACLPAWSPDLSASAVECLYPSRPRGRLPPTRTCCYHCQLALTMGTGSMSVMRHLQYGHWGARSCRPASSDQSVEQGACGSHCSSCQTLRVVPGLAGKGRLAGQLRTHPHAADRPRTLYAHAVVARRHSDLDVSLHADAALFHLGLCSSLQTAAGCVPVVQAWQCVTPQQAARGAVSCPAVPSNTRLPESSDPAVPGRWRRRCCWVTSREPWAEVVQRA